MDDVLICVFFYFCMCCAVNVMSSVQVMNYVCFRGVVYVEESG